MIGTLALLIGLSTLFFMIILIFIGFTDIFSIIILVMIFNIAQWLFAPYMINAAYSIKEISRSDSPRLYEMVERLSQKANIKMPKVMLANMQIPNAFAYGSPITGNRVAVTSGLMKELENEEVEAVIGHELGHLKHKDVQIMMFASALPAIFSFLGYSFLFSSYTSGGQRQGNAAFAGLIGMGCLAINWILSLFVLGLSRLREYYADRESANIVDDGPRKLSEGLAKIVSSTSKFRMQHKKTKNFSSFKSLFIDDPDRSTSDLIQLSRYRSSIADQKLVREILSREVTLTDRITEFFSTHPNIVKRMQALQSMK
jgi:heat shock protein HtpX